MKFLDKLFTREAPQPAPVAPVVVERSEGACLGLMIERDLERLRNEVRPARPAPVSEPSNAEIVERLLRAEMPAVIADSKALQRSKAANAKQHLEEERAIAADLARRTPPAKNGEVVGFEEYDPDFI